MPRSGLLLLLALLSFACSSPETLPTPEEIMDDGVVTDEERELARRAVFDCLADAGADTTFELFDVDPVVRRDYPEAYQRCLFDYAGLSRGNNPPGDAFDLGLLGIVECVEDRTGGDFGPKTIDEIGRLTPEAHRTVTAAIQTEPVVYDECEYDLRGDPSRALSYPDITGYRLDDGNPKRVLLDLADCGYITTARLEEATADSVTVEVLSTGPIRGPCTIPHPVRLKDPLGDREVIDVTSGRSIPPSGS
ncbi:MAG: hypothetical protein KY394_04630 [Actinobacteria bacterium]|nr:hypothetical protein [Actinomycetota bacterium]